MTATDSNELSDLSAPAGPPEAAGPTAPSDRSAPGDLPATGAAVRGPIRRRSWTASLAALRTYVEEHGDAAVPQAYRDPSDFALGWWVTGQRRRYRQGRLHEHRVALLESLPGWSWGSPSLGWDRYVAALRSYSQREGSTSVPKGHAEDGVSLAHWVVEQRSAARRGELSADQRATLEAVPYWSWDPLADSWEAHFSATRGWLEAGGQGSHLGGSATHDGLPVGRWADDQRRRARLGKLDEVRADRLESLPGWHWRPAEARWQERFDELEKVLAAGEARRGRTMSQALSWWCYSQRAAHAEGRLDEQHRKALDTLEGWSWSPLGDGWWDRLDQLRAHVAQSGSVSFQHQRSAGPNPLSFWVSRQRRARREGRLDVERVRALESIPTWSW